MRPNTTTFLATLILAPLALVGASPATPGLLRGAPPSSAIHGTWTELAPTPIMPRQEHSTVAINETTLAVIGGIEAFDGPPYAETITLVTYYDIPSDTWYPGPDLPHALNHPNAAVVDGKVYVLGGLEDTKAGIWTAIPDSWVLDLTARNNSSTWEPIAPIPAGTERGSAVVGVYGSLIYLAGGMRTLPLVPDAQQEAVNEVSVYDTIANQWTDLTGAYLPVPRDHAAGGIVGNTLYVIGGRDEAANITVSDTVFTLDLEDIEAGWTRLAAEEGGKMPTARGGLAAGIVDGVIYTFGGEGNRDSEVGIFDNVEAFDTRTGKWHVLEPMPVPRHGLVAATAGGRIYVPGGGVVQYAGPVDTMDVFRPSRGCQISDGIRSSFEDLQDIPSRASGKNSKAVSAVVT